MSNEGKKKKTGCLIGVIVVIVIMIAAMGGNEEKPKKVGTVDSGTSQQENETNSEEDTQATDNEFAIGDIVETDDFKISFISADVYVSDNQYIQPKDNHVYYRMEFEFENISDSDQTVSSMMDWNCYADGYAVDQSWIGDDGLDATLSAGKKVKGAIYYEVPEESSEIILEYNVDYFKEDKVIFIVK